MSITILARRRLPDVPGLRPPLRQRSLRGQVEEVRRLLRLQGQERRVGGVRGHRLRAAGVPLQGRQQVHRQVPEVQPQERVRRRLRRGELQ